MFLVSNVVFSSSFSKLITPLITLIPFLNYNGVKPALPEKVNAVKKTVLNENQLAALPRAFLITFACKTKTLLIKYKRGVRQSFSARIATELNFIELGLQVQF